MPACYVEPEDLVCPSPSLSCSLETGSLTNMKLTKEVRWSSQQGLDICLPLSPKYQACSPTAHSTYFRGFWRRDSILMPIRPLLYQLNPLLSPATRFSRPILHLHFFLEVLVLFLNIGTSFSLPTQCGSVCPTCKTTTPPLATSVHAKWEMKMTFTSMLTWIGFAALWANSQTHKNKHRSFFSK